MARPFSVKTIFLSLASLSTPILSIRPFCSINFKIFEKDSLNKIGENLSVNYIKQNVGIKLSESGAKAAAVTSIGIMKSSLVVDPITIKLDRPFLYLIKDANNVLLFVGILNYPTTSNASF